MEERKVVEKRTEVTREEREPKTKTTKVNISPDGSTQVQEESDLVDDDPVGSTTMRHEETVEKPQH